MCYFLPCMKSKKAFEGWYYLFKFKTKWMQFEFVLLAYVSPFLKAVDYCKMKYFLKIFLSILFRHEFNTVLGILSVCKEHSVSRHHYSSKIVVNLFVACKENVQPSCVCPSCTKKCEVADSFWIFLVCFFAVCDSNNSLNLFN